MVKLRFKRMGNKFNAFYRIVAADVKSPRDGRFIEEIGYFNPHSEELKIDKELALKWLNKGAQPTEVVKTLLTKEKIWKEFKDSKPKKAKKTTTSSKKPSSSSKKPSSSTKTAPKKAVTKKPAAKKTTVKKPVKAEKK